GRGGKRGRGPAPRPHPHRRAGRLGPQPRARSGDRGVVLLQGRHVLRRRRGAEHRPRGRRHRLRRTRPDRSRGLTMTAGQAVLAPPVEPRPTPLLAVRVRRYLPIAGLAVFIAGLGYLVVVPLVRLQALAFQDGARGYREAYSAPKIGTIIR